MIRVHFRYVGGPSPPLPRTGEGGRGVRVAPTRMKHTRMIRCKDRFGRSLDDMRQRKLPNNGHRRRSLY